MEESTIEESSDRCTEDALWEIYCNLNRLKRMSLERIEYWANWFIYKNDLKHLDVRKIEEYKGLLDGQKDHTDYYFFVLLVFLIKGLMDNNKEMIEESIKGLEALKNYESIELEIKKDGIKVNTKLSNKTRNRYKTNENKPRKVLKIFSIF